MTGTPIEGLIAFISFYCVLFFIAFLIVKLLKITNHSKYFMIIFAWILWLIFAIFVRLNITEFAMYEGPEIDRALFYLYFSTTTNPIHHIAMLFSLYKVIRGNMAE